MKGRKDHKCILAAGVDVEFLVEDHSTEFDEYARVLVETNWHDVDEKMRRKLKKKTQKFAHYFVASTMKST